MARVDDKTADAAADATPLGSCPRCREFDRAAKVVLERLGLVAPRPVVEEHLLAFPFGLERATAAALERSGELRVTKIGRRKYALRSEVLALVETLAPKRKPPTVETDPRAAYLALVGGQR